MRNKRARLTKKSECDGRENSIEITVPPMAVSIFSCTPEKVVVKYRKKTSEKNRQSKKRIK